MDMTAAALRSARVTEIRPLPASRYAAYYPSFLSRDGGGR
jgi:hypothetical protein